MSSPNASLRRASQLLQSGREHEALGAFEAVLVDHPGHPDASYLAGLLCLQREELDRAAPHLEAALAASPALPNRHDTLGSLRLRQGRAEEARALHARALALDPLLDRARFNLGNAHLALGAWPAAARCFLHLVQKDRRDGGAWLNLGLATWANGQARDAEHCFRMVLKVDRDNPKAWSELGAVVAHLGRMEEAEACCRAALQRAPTQPVYLAQLGFLLASSGRPDEAEAAFRAALAQDPAHHAAVAGLAQLHEAAGRIDDAAALLAPLPEADLVASHALAQVAALVWDRRGRRGAALDLLDAALAEPRPSDHRASLLFGKARILDRAGEAEAAIQAALEANALRGRQWDAAAFARRVDALIETFSAEAFARLPRAAVDGSGLVFIVGLPRSGTSLLEQILDCHPAIHGAGELPDVHRMVAALEAGRPLPAAAAGWTAGDLTALAAPHVAALAERAAGAALVSDKMPLNVLYLGHIALLFPGARVLLAVRDPLDCHASCLFQNFKGEAMGFTATPAGLAAWQAGHDRLVAHWRAALPLALETVVYEDLVRAPEAGIRAVLAFLGQPWDPACLHPEANPRRVHTASYDQVRRPIHAGAIGRGRPYARWLA